MRTPCHRYVLRMFFLFCSPIFLSFVFVLFCRVSSHPGRPPKYSSVPELGSHTPTSPSSCLTASPAPEWPNTGGSFPFHVHPHHTLPLPSPSSGDVSSSWREHSSLDFLGLYPNILTSPILAPPFLYWWYCPQAITNTLVELKCPSTSRLKT